MDDEGINSDGGSFLLGVNPKNKLGKPRTRVSRACDRCRSKKDKCDGQRPTCSACAAGRHVCIYDPSTKKRGLPEGYVRGIEKLWALAMGKVGGLEDSVSALLEDKDQLQQIWNHDVVGEELHEKWKNSQILRKLEDLLTNLESTGNTKIKSDGSNSPANDGSPYHKSMTYRVVSASEPVKDSQHIATSHNGLHRLSAAADMLSVSTTPVKDDAHMPSRKRQRVEDPKSTQQEESASLSLPAHAPRILDFYFSYTHCWLPIIERHQVLRTTYTYSEGPIDTTTLPSSEHAALWAILALSSYQYARAFQIANTGSPPVDIDSQQIYETARRLIPKEHAGYEIGHLQALLLLALVDFGHGKLSASWTLIGQAVRIAIDLGLDSMVENRKAKTAFLACFLLDTLIAARLGRQPHLRSKDALLAGQVDENGLEEWDPWKDYLGQPSPDQKPGFALSTFNRLIEVFMVLNDVICDSSERQTDVTQAQLNRLHKIISATRDMRSWIEVPESLKNQALLPHQMVFLMSFKTTELAIHMRAYPYLGVFDNPERVAPQSFHIISTDILRILVAYESQRFIFLMPPIVEYPLRLAFETAVLAKPLFGETHKPGYISFNSWLENMSRIVGTLQACWPGLHLLHDALDKETYLTDLMSPTLTSATLKNHNLARQPAPVMGSTHQSYNMMPRKSVNSAHMNIDSFPPNQSQSGWAGNQSAIPANMSAPTPMQMSPNSPDVARSLTGSDSLVPSIDPSLTMGSSSIVPGIAIPAGNFEDQAGSTYATSITMDMTNDLDAIFDDLAHLDTTDWATEREHAFKDFGFNDETTFRAFCNDPERLNPSNSATPLMSSQQPPLTSSSYLMNTLNSVNNSGTTSMDKQNTSKKRSSSKGYSSSTQIPSLPEGVGW